MGVDVVELDIEGLVFGKIERNRLLEEKYGELRYKCMHCKIVIPEGALVENACPQCNSTQNLVEMCPNDHLDCSHDMVDSIAYCELCREAMCPICRCHDVESVSRVTGYLSAVNGWNSAKKQELKDRTRVSNAELLNK